MGIRDDILAVPNEYQTDYLRKVFTDTLNEIILIAEKREAELLAEIDVLNESNESLRNQNTCLDEKLAELEAERAQMIAELKQLTLNIYCKTEPNAYYTLEAIINKYEAMTYEIRR